MRTTINIDDALLAEAAELTGIKKNATLVRMALEALISADAAKQLAALGGTMPDLEVPPRRREWQ
ncbi:MAG: type II toxin-antitoxin system VapB family antitoxin [Candidatus Hydrogenedentota bacterium]